MRVMLSILAGLAVAGPVAAADLVFLIHPKGLLDPATAKEKDGPLGKVTLGRLLGRGAPDVVGGDKVAALPATEDTIVIEFPPAAVTPVKRKTPVKPVGGGATEVWVHTDALVQQPVKVWHAPGADAKPVLLGETYLSVFGSQLVTAADGTLTQSKDTPDELARRHLGKMFETSADRVRDALAAKVLTGRMHPLLTAADERQVTVAPPPSFGPMGWKIGFGVNGSPAVPRYKPARVSRAGNDAFVEVDLHNRLPVATEGTLQWATEGANAKLPQGNLPDLPFKLAAGEKVTLKAPVTAETAKVPNVTDILVVRLEELKLGNPTAKK